MKRPLLVLSVLLLSLVAFLPLGAQKDTTIKIQNGETIDNFARRYLKNPRHMQQLLKRNGMVRGDFRPGRSIQIPVAFLKRGDAIVLTRTPRASYSRSVSETWDDIYSGLQLYRNDRLKTGKQGAVQMAFGNGMTVRIKGDTRLIIQPGRQPGSGSLYLKEGRIRAFSKALSGRTDFQVVTPAAIAAVRGTDFLTDVEPGGKTFVAVTEGTVLVSAQGKQVKVPAGSKVTIEPGQAPGPLQRLIPPPRPR